MFRKTFTGTLVAASLTAGALMTIPSASATPTYLASTNVSHSGLLPDHARIAMSENGTAVATWIRSVGGVDRVQASYFAGGPNGSWTFPDTITSAADVVVDSNVAINAKGDAVVTWLEADNSDDMRVAASRYLGSGTFDGMSFVSTDNQLDTSSGYDVAIDGAGKVIVAHMDHDNDAVNRVRVSTLTKAGVNASLVFSDDSSVDPEVAVDEAGDALVAWRDEEGGPDTIRMRRFSQAATSWTTLNVPGLGGMYGQGELEVAMGDNGSATVAVTKLDDNFDYRAMAYKVGADGFVGNANTVSPVNRTATAISLAQNDAGTAYLTWFESGNGNRIGYSTRPQTSGWANPALLPDVLAGSAKPKASISDTGMTFVSYVDAGHLDAAFRLTPLGILQPFDSGDQDFVAGTAQAGTDDQGNAVIGGVMDNGGGNGSFHASFLDTAGATASVTAAGTGANTLATAFDVSWGAVDRFSTLGTGNVRVRSAAWNGGFGGYAYPFVNTASKKLSFAGAAGRTYCFEAQARDSHANIGAYSAPRCTTTPVDDRSLAVAKGFKRAKAGTSYLGTYSVAKKKNAVMTLKNVQASRIAVVVSKVAKGGKIRVFFAGTKIGDYSLKGTGNKVLVAVKGFGSVKTGNLVIKVISKKGKVVRIDGVVAAIGG